MTALDDESQQATLNTILTTDADLMNASVAPPNFSELLELTDIYIFTKDTSGCYTYANKKMQAFLGASLTEIIGKNDQAFFEPALSHELQLNDRRVLDFGVVISSEETTVNKISQEQQVFLIVKSPLRNALGNIIGLLGIATDISNLKKAEQSLITQQEDLKLALANIKEGLVISNKQDDIISFNAFASLFALESPQTPIISTTINKLDESTEVSNLAGKKRAIETPLLPAIQIIDEPMSAELEYHSKETEKDWITQFNYAPIRNEQGLITGTVSLIRDITEERKSQLTLKQANHQLLSFIKHAPVSFAIFDKQMNYLAASEKWRLDFKLGQEELRGLNHYQLFPDLPPQWLSIHQQGLSGAYLNAHDDLWIREDGSEYVLDWAVSPWYDETDTIAGIIIYSDDVSHHKQELQDLAHLEKRLEVTLEFSGIGFWDLDLKTDSAWRSQGHDKLFGYNEALPHWGVAHFLEPIIPEQKEQVKQCFAEALHSRILKIDYQIKHPNQSLHWISTQARVLCDDQNQPVRMLGINKDITDRKHIEQHLRIAAAAFESQNGTIITDSDTIILEVNSAFTKITGYSPEDVVGKHTRILSSGRHPKDFYVAMWVSINSTGFWEGEVWNRHKQGNEYPQWLSITAVKNEQNQVSHYVAIINDITERKYHEETINQLAFYDSLTKLPNRTLLQDRLKQAFASCARNNDQGALMFIDLDNFKLLNDSLGHDIGDELLKQVAERLQNCVREGDTVARLGGDEFIILLQNLSPLASVATSQSQIIAEKILSSLRSPYKLKQHDYISTPSIGFSLFKDHDTTIDDVLKQADIAMYQAKSTGRNKIRFFDQSMQDKISERAQLENELRIAFHNHQFQLYYQPQVDHQGKLTGAEALIRWHHPTKGLLLPTEFISIAEEMGIISLIGEWVIDRVCQQLLSWAKHPISQQLQIAVNVSAYQFRQKNFTQQVLNTLSRNGVQAKLLKLELTESLLIDNVEDVIDKMNTLKEQGICFSLDDFGTGYSSLYYLKKLPLDQLKIDQGFIRDLLTDSNDAAISLTILALAKSMDLNVIAEGVETQAQRDFLEHQGCLDFQGHLFGSAMPIEQFEAQFFA